MKLAALATLLALASPVLAQPAPPPVGPDAPEPSPADAPAPPLVAPEPSPPAAEPPPAPVIVPAPVEDPQPAPTAGATVTTALGDGITVTAPDDSSSMQIRARLQLRATQFSDEDGEPPEVTEFLARRIRLQILGHALGGDWTYYLQLSFSNLDMEPDLRLPLRDAYITYARPRDLNIRVGQMKVPFGRQRVTSSSALQMPDRSIVVGELNLDRDVGIQARSEDLFGQGGTLGYQLGLFHGNGRNRLATEPGVLVVGRFVVRPFGGFDDDSEVDFQRHDHPKLAIGVAAARNWNTNRPRSTLGDPFELARFDYTHATADVTFKYRGIYAISEVIYREASEPFVEQDLGGELVREYSRSAWGYFAQAGYLFPSNVEVVGRYGELHPIGDTDPDIEDRHELAGGLNYYWSEHDLKLQSDYTWLYGPEFGEGRHQIRVQLQLYY